MKILFQTNNRLNYQLEQEYKKLAESGHEIVPFGYYLNNITHDSSCLCGSHNKTSLELTGLEGIDLDNDKHYMRCGIKLMRHGILGSVIVDHRPFKTVCYSDSGFATKNIPESDKLLNKTPGSYAFTSFLNICDIEFDCDIFIKPINDLKDFEAFILPKGKTIRERYADNPDFVKDRILYPVHISANVHKITEEVRCYVVNHKVVTISRYRYNDEFNMDPIPEVFKQQYIAYAQDIVDNLYAPADNFTLDLCEVSGKIFVMEYNCLTTSGLYECDSKALFDALELYYYPN